MHRLSTGTAITLVGLMALLLGGCASSGFAHRVDGDGAPGYSASPDTSWGPMEPPHPAVEPQAP